MPAAVTRGQAPGRMWFNQQTRLALLGMLLWSGFAHGEIKTPWPTNAYAAPGGIASLHWSFQPLLTPAVPSVRNQRWPNNDLDRFILTRLEATGLAPALAADKRTLIRRVTFDLTGLPPAPEEVDA